MIYSHSVQFARMINDLNNITQTSHAPENGCRKAALSAYTMKDVADPGHGPGPSRPGSKRKREVEENDEVELRERRANLKCFSYGFVSMIGRRREMEDAVAIAVEVGLPAAAVAGGGEGTTKEYDFFGVYDGHGGSRVANACRERLHELLVETVVAEGGDGGGDGGGVIGWEKAMMECFQKMDEEVVNLNGPAVASMGSTAVVAAVGEKELVVANCGDSRAVLSRDGAAVPLSIDHKPNRADELERIELLGGRVIDWNGHRVLGVLSTSRSIGDEYLKPYVIPVPEVTISERTKGDEFLILASDGLWDVIPNDVACHIVRRCLRGHVKRRPPFKIPAVSAEMPAILSKNDGVAAEAASILAELAIARGSTDNISVIIVQLEGMKTSSSSSSSSRGGGKAVRKSSGGTVVGKSSGGTVLGQSSGTVH